MFVVTQNSVFFKNVIALGKKRQKSFKWAKLEHHTTKDRHSQWKWIFTKIFVYNLYSQNKDLKMNTFLKVFLILTQYCEIRIIESRIHISLRIRSISSKQKIF